MIRRKYIPQIFTKTAKNAVYRFYQISEKIIRPPFDRYDFETFEVVQRVLTPQSNCIDVGAHKGEILKKILKAAPRGRHFAFEPIPHLYNRLQKKFGKRVLVSNSAVADTAGEANFTVFKNRPAVSGLKDRVFDTEQYEKETIPVHVNTLDNLVGLELPVALIKIDVEGAEMQVIQGAQQIIGRWRPVVLFEFSAVNEQYYDNKPEALFDFFSRLGMSISIQKYFLSGKPSFDKSDFCSHYRKGYNYFFMAYDAQKFLNKQAQ